MNVEQAVPPGVNRLTVERLLIPLLTRPRVAQTIKYAVYLSLVVNLFLYLRDDYLAMVSSLPADAPLMDLLTRFSTTVDMTAWVALIFLFELETYALPNEAFTRAVTWLLRLARALCYVSILSAAAGYTLEGLETFDYRAVPEATGACDFADQGMALQLDSIEYVEITADNCAGLTADSAFYRLDGETAVLPASRLPHVQLMGVIDIVNAFVWIIVVVFIEAEVWLQAKDRFSGRALAWVRQANTLFYLVLIGNGFIWAFSGYPLYAWDAFLWIFGFWAIELNLAEWEIERLEELRGEQAAGAAAG